MAVVTFLPCQVTSRGSPMFTEISFIMIEQLLQTDANYVSTFLRIIAGIVIFPYGMQKLFGWFDGPGIKGSLEQLTARNIPTFIAWLIIIGQS